MALRTTGLSHDETLRALDVLKTDDVRWREGRAFTLTYHGGDDVVALAEQAYQRFSSENALNTEAFPSLRRIQAEVVDIALGWLGGPPGSAGFMTSGAPRASCSRSRVRASEGARNE